VPHSGTKTTPSTASLKALRSRVAGPVKGILRRTRDEWLPSPDIREYNAWKSAQLVQCATRYIHDPRPGLLSILSAVWDGSPIAHLRKLARSIASQNVSGICEWIVVDNGVSRPALLAYLTKLRNVPWIKIVRHEENVGIIRGLRSALEHATSRYVLPVDADDLLSPDALRIIASSIYAHDFPVLLYTDEDKVLGARFLQPYFKPDWDPVLLVNSAYIAHLGVIDREKALALGAYLDPATEGSPDWDLFLRFHAAGHAAIHIPEIVYSWRVHATSTADDAATKNYIHSSQQAVLERFLQSRPDGTEFEVELSPLFGRAAHWRIRKRQVDAAPFATVLLLARSGSHSTNDVADTTRLLAFGVNENPRALLPVARELAAQKKWIALIGEDVVIDDDLWPNEVEALFQLHPTAAMVGGRIRNSTGTVTDAGRIFGFGGVAGCPFRGLSWNEPGYFAQLWKQHSVSAVSSQFSAVRASFLIELIDGLPSGASLAFLGAWAGALAFRNHQHIVFTPFLSGVSDLDWETLVDPDELQLFSQLNSSLIPDYRFYSPHLSLSKAFAPVLH
jgi:hypothetical protein